MTANVLTGAAGFLTRYERLRGQLPGDPGPRDAAAAAFRRMDVPGGAAGRREEAWKYTNLRPLAETSFQQPLSLPDAEALLADVPRIADARLVFIDGGFRPQLSSLPEVAAIRCFAEQARFGTLARPEQEPLVALNTMLAEDGAVIEVPDNTDAGLVQLVSSAPEASGRAIAFHPRHMIRLGRGARPRDARCRAFRP